MTIPLTVGIATHQDYSGLWSTVQSLRLYHAEAMAQCELLIVDNSPDGPYGEAVRGFLNWVRETMPVRYIPFGEIQGTAAPRQKIFDEAAGEAVLVGDSHIMLAPGALQRLLDHYAAHPGTRDLYAGPMLYDSLLLCASEFADEWRGQMWGTWKNHQVKTLRKDAHAIGAMGLGLFSCRKDAWLGFNPRFRQFGGEEWYIHEKFRQAGARCICLPWLTWPHRFDKPEGTRYPRSLQHTIRNYILGHRELGLPLDRCQRHFVDGWDESAGNVDPAFARMPAAEFDSIVASVDAGTDEIWETKPARSSSNLGELTRQPEGTTAVWTAMRMGAVEIQSRLSMLPAPEPALVHTTTVRA